MDKLAFTISSAIPEPFSENYLFAKDEVPEFLVPERVHNSVNATASEHLVTSSAGSYATLSNSTNSSGSSIILDYGVAVAGIPVLRIHGLDAPSGRAVVEFSVSEGYAGITKPEGDGPYPFSAGADSQHHCSLC